MKIRQTMQDTEIYHMHAHVFLCVYLCLCFVRAQLRMVSQRSCQVPLIVNLLLKETFNKQIRHEKL